MSGSFSIFVNFSTMQGAPLVISFTFSPALRLFLARFAIFAIARLSGHKWTSLSEKIYSETCIKRTVAKVTNFSPLLSGYLSSADVDL